MGQAHLCIAEAACSSIESPFASSIYPIVTFMPFDDLAFPWVFVSVAHICDIILFTGSPFLPCPKSDVGKVCLAQRLRWNIKGGRICSTGWPNFI
jgi:hypothetical protein